MELLPSFLRSRLSAAAVISLLSSVFRCCLMALLHFVAVSCMALLGHSVDVDSIHISHAHIFIIISTCYHAYFHKHDLIVSVVFHSGC